MPNNSPVTAPTIRIPVASTNDPRARVPVLSSNVSSTRIASSVTTKELTACRTTLVK